MACALALGILGVPGPGAAAVPSLAEHPGSPLECHPIAVRTAGGTPVGVTTCSGVRPGALVETTLGHCTLNFVFRGGNARTYIGTAGHCIIGSEDPLAEAPPTERVWASGKGPIVYDATGRRIGRFAYAVLNETKDFALIQVDSGVAVNPAMCHFGGPNGTTSSRSAPSVLHYYGNGIGAGDLVPARTAVASYMGDPNHVYAWGVVTLGDSGGGVIDSTGKAVGVIVTTGGHLGARSWTDAGLMGITRLAPQVSRAATKLGTSLTLRTASF